MPNIQFKRSVYNIKAIEIARTRERYLHLSLIEYCLPKKRKIATDKINQTIKYVEYRLGYL